MKKKSCFCIALLLAVFFNDSTHAQYCPKKIAAFENGIAAKAYSKILIEVYKRLNCEVEIVFLPSKRGIVAFNRGEVDGELYRLAVTETKYSTPFVRSKIPLYQYRAGIWHNPSHIKALAKPIGYVRGMTWQVKHIESHPELRSVEFNSPGNVLDAYERGVIGRFLSGESMMYPKLANHEINPTPVLREVLIDKPIYHYVNARFAPFMDDFSKEISKNNTFKDVVNYFD